MLIYFSVKSAIILASISFVISIFWKAPRRLSQFLDVLSMGTGRMLQRELIPAVIMMIFTVLYYHMMQFFHSFFNWGEYWTWYIWFMLIGGIVYVGFGAPDATSIEKKERENEKKLQVKGESAHSTSALKNDEDDSGKVIRDVAVVGGAYVLAQMSANKNEEVTIDYDDDYYESGREHDELLKEEREKVRLEEEESIERDFEMLEEMRRFEEDNRLHRELEELHSYSEEAHDFLQDSMDDQDSFLQDMDEYNDYDTFDDFHDSYEDDYYDSYDDDHNTFDDFHDPHNDF